MLQKCNNKPIFYKGLVFENYIGIGGFIYWVKGVFALEKKLTFGQVVYTKR